MKEAQLTKAQKEDQIDKKSLEISQADDDVYTDMATLADELPDNSPRFVLLSYPLTMVLPFPSSFSFSHSSYPSPLLVSPLPSYVHQVC